MTVYLDAGHGGLDPIGKYTTKGKQFDHKKGSFHDGTVFYEGVFNRKIAELARLKLKQIGILGAPVYASETDWSLSCRVNRANAYYNSSKDKKAIYISIHSNAANGKARGWSVWTTKNNTVSDKIADKLHEITKDVLPEIQMRQDTSDGDKDYEENFQVLRDTKMPAILIEFLFFDNYEDACLLMDEDIQERFATTIALVAKWYDENY